MVNLSTSRDSWRSVVLIFVATTLLLLGTCVSYLFLSRNKVPVTVLTANSRIPAAYSFTVLVRLKVGDVFGDGRQALVVNMPEPSKPFEWPIEEKPGDYVTVVYRWAGGRLVPVFHSAPQTMPVNELTLADTNGNGHQEIWFGYFGDASQPAALEWEGTGFSPLQAWSSWPKQPVVIGEIPGRPASLLVFSDYVTPELARDFAVVRNQGGVFTKTGAFQPGQAFSPKDRAQLADVNGDGKPELLMVTGRMNLLHPPRPFTISRPEDGTPLLTLDGVFPDDMEVVDLNGNGIPEIYLSENLPLEVGKPYRGAVRGLEWDGRGYRTIYYEEFNNQRWVCDLASGDLTGDGRPKLIIGILRAIDGIRYRLSLELREYAGVKAATGGQ